jgi:hypothetical protein
MHFFLGSLVNGTLSCTPEELTKVRQSPGYFSVMERVVIAGDTITAMIDCLNDRADIPINEWTSVEGWVAPLLACLGAQVLLEVANIAPQYPEPGHAEAALEAVKRMGDIKVMLEVFKPTETVWAGYVAFFFVFAVAVFFAFNPFPGFLNFFFFLHQSL